MDIEKSGPHKVGRNLTLLHALGFPIGTIQPELKLATHGLDRAKRQLRTLVDGEPGLAIGIHAGSGAVEAHKRWSTTAFSQLIDGLVREHRAQVLLFSGPAEKDLGAAIKAGLSTSALNLTHDVPLTNSLQELAVYLASCTLLIGGDSGVMHVAAAVGTPVLSIFGPTDPAITAPFTRSIRILQSKRDCAPCYAPHFMTGCGEPRCMSDIQPAAVLAAVRSMLTDYSAKERVRDLITKGTCI